MFAQIQQYPSFIMQSNPIQSSQMSGGKANGVVNSLCKNERNIDLHYTSL